MDTHWDHPGISGIRSGFDFPVFVRVIRFDVWTRILTDPGDSPG